MCAEYSITCDTLIKHIGTREVHKVIPGELKGQAVRLRVQGKTRQQAADIIVVTEATVKQAFPKVKSSPEIKENRVNDKAVHQDIFFDQFKLLVQYFL